MDEVSKRIEEAKANFNTEILLSEFAIKFIRVKTNDGVKPLDLHTINQIKEYEKMMKKEYELSIEKDRNNYKLIFKKFKKK